MQKRKMVLLDIDYVTLNDKPVIRLFGKEKLDNEEKAIIALDDSFKPYIYVIPDNLDLALENIRELGFDDIELLDLQYLGQDEEVIKIIFKHPQEVSKYRDEIRDLANVKDIYEYDIPFYRRYLVNNNIFPMNELELSGKLVESSSCVSNPPENIDIIELDEPPKPLVSDFPDLKILSFDLEVRNPHGMPNAERDEIIMIGVSGNMGIDKVISNKSSNLDFVETVEDEKAIIETFIKTVKDNQPDLIVGYNSDNFDFPYLEKRAKLYNIDLNLGLDGSSLRFQKKGFTEAVSLKGILHIDLYLVMRRYIRLDRYTLERVYLELFGEEKKDVPGDEIWKYWDSDDELLDELFKYSLDDVVATSKIAQETLPVNLGLTRLIGQPFFDITRMTTGQQVEWYLVRQAYEYGELVPNKPSADERSSRKGQSNVGGYVKEPDIGLHENLVQFDFRSLYPSIIISKNVCPDSLINEDLINHEEIDNDKVNIAPEYGYKFLKEPKGFIPSVIGNVLAERIKIKKQMKASIDPVDRKVLDVEQQAIKRVANTMYGAYGYSRFRWYSMECAESITAWGRNYIKSTMKKAEDFGFKTIYADTDGFYAKYVPELKKES